MLTLAPNNIDELLAELDQLIVKLQNKAVRSGLVAVAAPVKRTMRELAPKQHGSLAQSVNHRLLNKRQKARLSIADDQVAIIVGPNKKVQGANVAWKANMLEHGIKAHNIKPKKSNKKGVLRIGGDFASGDIKHPGVKANPFMARAIEQHQGDVEPRFYQGLTKALARIRQQ